MALTKSKGLPAITDAAVVGVALSSLEQILNQEIADELLALRPPEQLVAEPPPPVVSPPRAATSSDPPKAAVSAPIRRSKVMISPV